MSIDHSLALHYSNVNKPIIRFFGWTPKTLSLGFHQKESDFNLEKVSNDSLGFVRRPTGGRAIFHGHELTYSVIFPNGHYKKNELYKKVHQAFINGFNELNVNIEFNRKEADLAKFYKTKESLSCFSASAKYEANFNGKKFIGSAQRVYDEAILQHGSIMLSEDFLNVIDYSNLPECDKPKMRETLKEKTFYWDLDAAHITIEQLCDVLMKHFMIEFGIIDLEENAFDIENWTYLNEC